jgi:chemotaxis protein methyltransferase CheR
MQINVPEHDQVPLEKLRQCIIRYTGIYYSEQKKDILYIRLLQLCMKKNIKDLSMLLQKLQTEDFHEMILNIAQTVSTTYTYFFREPEVLGYFKDKILDYFPINDKIRIWSAATSSGEEAYTISMIILEKMGLEQKESFYSILGTDINSQVISQAEAGIYSKENLNEMPKELIKRYFEATDNSRFSISDKVKKLCLFRRLNLTSGNWPFVYKFNIIFCRNVLYYFEKNQQKEVLNYMHELTVPNGFLITSVTESLNGLGTRWVTILPGIHQKK